MLLDKRRVIKNIIFSTAQSFGDMNKYVKYNNSDEIHYWSGSLLFHNNAYEEALKAFNDAK